MSEWPGMSDSPNQDPDFYSHLRSELSDGWRWLDRAVVLAYGAVAGLVVVAFTLLSYAAFSSTKRWPIRRPAGSCCCGRPPSRRASSG